MVTVVDVKVVENNNTGESFMALVIQGDMEMVQSKQTGKFYATARTCNIPCTFGETMAAQMIGKTMQGAIEKIPCEPYSYVVKETGEQITLDYTWSYNPTPSTTVDADVVTV